MVKRRISGWASTASFYGLAGVFMLPTVFVFYWMITLSLKPQVEATAFPPSLFRFSLTTRGYQEVFTKYPFLLYSWNSLVVALGSTALGLAVGLPAAYSIARWLHEMDQRGVLGRYFHPPLTNEERGIADREGWILGIA